MQRSRKSPSSHPMTRDNFVAAFRAELRRIGLDPAELTGLAASGDPDTLLVHVRALPAGSSWADVFPGVPEGWSPGAPRPERALGPFDYQGPPWSIVVFGSLHSEDPKSAGEAAIRRAQTLGCPIYGAGVILDRGHPHFYIVLTLDATEEMADAVADALRDQHGVGNAYPIRRDGSS